LRHGSESDRALEGETVASSGTGPWVSVIVPVTERPEPLVGLYWEYAAALQTAGYRFEFLFVTDPAYRAMTEPLAALVKAGEPIRVYTVGQSSSDGALLTAAIGECRAPVVVTLPSYRRVTAEGIPQLIRRVSEGADLAVARRWPRQDSLLNRLQTSAFHALLRWLTHSTIEDIACGVRAARREVLAEVPMHGDFYRFLPLVAQRDGYRVEQVDVAQHPAERRTRLYGPGTYLRRLIDVLGLAFLLRFTQKPLRFFGLIGSAACLAGSSVLFVLFVQRLQGRPLADRPLLLLGMLFLVLGVQFIALGLIGEIIVHLHSPGWRPYRIREGGVPTAAA